MKTIIYVKLSEKVYKPEKGFVSKAKEFFSRRDDEGILCVMKNLYDERNIIIGYMAEFFIDDAGDDELIKKYHESIFALSEKYGADVCFEDISSVCGYPHAYYDGSSHILSLRLAGLEKNAENGDFIGVYAPKDADMSLMEKIADLFSYIVVFTPQKEDGEIIFRHLMDYNRTAVIITDNSGGLCGCFAVISLKRDICPGKGICKDYISPYPAFAAQSPQMRYFAYTDNFTPVQLSASVCEAVGDR